MDYFIGNELNYAKFESKFHQKQGVTLDTHKKTLCNMESAENNEEENA